MPSCKNSWFQDSGKENTKHTKKSMKYSVVTENKDMLRNWWSHAKGHRSQFEGVPKANTRAITKINDSNLM